MSSKTDNSLPKSTGRTLFSWQHYHFCDNHILIDTRDGEHSMWKLKKSREVISNEGSYDNEYHVCHDLIQEAYQEYLLNLVNHLIVSDEGELHG